MNPKIQRIFNKYRALLKKRLASFEKNYGRGNLRKGNRSKRSILRFYENNDRWPKRAAKSKREQSLGNRFENFISKGAVTYDAQLRRIVMATGRVTNNKCKHNVQAHKKEIIEFIESHGRVPSTSYKYQTIPGEARLRAKLDYYTQEAGDKTLLGEIYSLDKCHKSGIPVKYRPIINQSLDVEKPLVRLPNYVLDGDLNNS